MNTHNNYKSDKQKGTMLENAAEARLNYLGLRTENTQNWGKFADFDIRSTGNTNVTCTYEVKLNTNSEGWFYLELGKHKDGINQPAGLSATKAEYYVLGFTDDPALYIIPTAKLQELVDSKRYIKTHRDKNNYLLAIFDRPFFLQHCHIL